MSSVDYHQFHWWILEEPLGKILGEFWANQTNVVENTLSDILKTILNQHELLSVFEELAISKN